MIVAAFAIGFVAGLLCGVALAWPYAWKEGHDARACDVRGIL